MEIKRKIIAFWINNRCFPQFLFGKTRLQWRKTLYAFVFPDPSLGNKRQEKSHLYDTIDFYYEDEIAVSNEKTIKWMKGNESGFIN